MAKRIKVYVCTNKTGSKVEDEFDAPEDWDQMDDTERDEYLDQVAQDHLSNSADFGAYVVDEN